MRARDANNGERRKNELNTSGALSNRAETIVFLVVQFSKSIFFSLIHTRTRIFSLPIFPSVSIYVYIYIYISISSVCTFNVLHGVSNKWVFSEINFSDLAGHVNRALLSLRGKLRGIFVKTYFPPQGLNALTTFAVKTVTNIRTCTSFPTIPIESNERFGGPMSFARYDNTQYQSDSNYRAADDDRYRFRKFHSKRTRVRICSCFISSSLFRPSLAVAEAVEASPMSSRSVALTL